MPTATADFPEQYHRAVAAEWQHARRWIIGALCAALPLTALAVLDRLPPIVAAVVDAFAVWIVVTSLGGLHDTISHLTIFPYFERAVGEIDTYAQGKALARSLNRLDRLAQTAGVPTVSSFGFNDDLRGQPLIWHNATDGLATIHALQQALTDDDDQLLAADLRRLDHALRHAADQGIRFCLLMSHTNTTSGHEWSVRKGTAF